jgi:FdrA protein
MSIIETEVRRGAYYDSVILMQLQRALSVLNGVEDAGVVMGTEANKDLLAQSNLITANVAAAVADDLIIAVRASSEEFAHAALAQVNTLLSSRRSNTISESYRPKSLSAAISMLPDARWVLISVPGRYAAEVARDALSAGKNVFLYSDNVSMEDEFDLKAQASESRLLLMGPDCGTAIVNGIGLGFANRVRRGQIGVVGASGTGLQQVTCRIHQLGAGITHAIGTGGRDLAAAIGAKMTYQALDLLAHDQETAVIVIISKPPAANIAQQVIRRARRIGKPVIINFIGHYAESADAETDRVYFAATLDETAQLAIQLAATEEQPIAVPETETDFAPSQRYLRGLFSGGTLAYESLLLLQSSLPLVFSNIPLHEEERLPDSTISYGHTVIDLGEDEFTVGRLHPMIDNELRLRRLQQEADDPTTAIILLDVVLGYGAHPNPASELAPVIAAVRKQAEADGRTLEVIALVVGTDEDPQDLSAQIEQLTAAGAHVETTTQAAIGRVSRLLSGLAMLPPTAGLAALHEPLTAINVGLESFNESLLSQDATSIQVDWRPPAGGNAQLMSILSKMRS